MPGIRISLDANEANAAIKRFEQNLKTTGMAAMKTEKEIAALQNKMLQTASDRKIHGSFNDLSRMLNLSQGEASKLQKQLGITSKAGIGEVEQLTGAFGGMGGSIMKAAGAMMTFASIMAGVVGGVMAFTSLLKKGVEQNSEWQLSAIRLTAMWLPGIEEGGRDMGQMYQDTKAYADQLLLTLEKIDKETFANATDLRLMTEEMAKQNIILDINNDKQVQAFKNIANAVSTVAAGAPNKEIQVRQEMRSLLLGEARVSDTLGQMLKARIPDLEKEVKLHREQGDLLEWIGGELRGFAAAQGDINASWEAIKSSLETIYNKTLREGFGGAFRDIIGYAKELGDWATQHRSQIQALLEDGWYVMKDILDSIVRLYKDHKEAIDKMIDVAFTLVGILGDALATVLYDVLGLLADCFDDSTNWKEELLRIYETVKIIWTGIVDVATIALQVIKVLNMWLNPLKAFRDFLIPIANLIIGIFTLDVDKMGAALGTLGKSIQERVMGVIDLPGNINDKLNKRFNKREQDTVTRQQREWDRQAKFEYQPGVNVPSPKTKPMTAGDKGGGKEDQIAAAVQAWKDKIEELNPELEKEGKELTKLQNEYDKLRTKLEVTGKGKKGKGGSDVSGPLAEIKAEFDKGKMFLFQKWEKQSKLFFDKYKQDVLINQAETDKQLLTMEQNLEQKKMQVALENGEMTESQIIERKFEMQQKMFDKEIELLNFKSDKERLASDEQLRKLKEIEEAKKLANADYVKRDLTGWQSPELIAIENAIKLKEKEKDINVELVDLERQLHDAKLKENVGWYDTENYEISQKKKLANELEDMQGKYSPEVIAKYRADKEKKIQIDKDRFIVEHSEDVTDVLRAQNNLIKNEAKSTAGMIGEAYKECFDGMKDTMSDFFNDAFNGELKNGEDYFQAFAKTINRIFADMIAEMISKKLMSGLMGGLLGGEGGGISGLGGLLGALLGGGGSSAGTNDMTSGWGTGGIDPAVANGPAFAKGDVFSTAGLEPYSNKIIAHPTLFRFAKGAQFGVMGEGGSPEAVMPLARDASGRLGVRSSGQESSMNISIPISINSPISKRGAFMSELRSEVEKTCERVMKRAS